MMLRNKPWKIYDENFSSLLNYLGKSLLRNQESKRLQAVINFSSPFGQTKAVILLYSALPSTMGNNVLKTPAHFPAGVNHA